MTAPTEENNASTPSATTSVTVEQAADALANVLFGRKGNTDSLPQLQEATLTLFKNLAKFCSPRKINVCVTLTHFHPRRKLLLHKNIYSILLEFSDAPTNNNTHTPEEKAATP